LRGAAGHALLIALASIAVYLPALTNGFVYDDHDLIEANPIVTSGWRRLPDHFVTDYWQLTRAPSSYYRPVTTVSLLLDSEVWGLRPFGFHLTSILWHGACAVALYLLVRRLLPSSPFVALASGLLFGLHPIHTQSVVWIAGRTDVLATAFLLAATIAYVDFRVRGGSARVLAFAVCLLLALLSKETAGAGVVLLPLVELALRRSRPVPLRRPLVAAAAAAGVLAGILAVRHAVLGGFMRPGGGIDPTAWWTSEDGTAARLRTVGEILLYQVGRLVWPHPLSLEDGIAPRQSIGLDIVAGFAIVLALGVAAVALRRRAPIASLAIALYLLAIAPVSNVMPLYQAAQEHFLYLPSVGFAIALAMLLARAGRMRWALTSAFALVYAVLTVSRCGAWKDDVTIWRDAVRTRQESSRARVGLATAYYMLHRAGDANAPLDSAMTSLEWVLDREPGHFHATLLSGVIAYERGERDSALARFDRAHTAFPENATAAFNFGKLLLESGSFDRADRVLTGAAARGPEDPNLLMLLGSARRLAGRPATAIAPLVRATSLLPESGRAWLELGFAQAEVGANAPALAALERARPAVGEDPILLYNIACLECRLGRHASALSSLEAAVAAGYRNRRLLESDPDLAPIRGEPRFKAVAERMDGGLEPPAAPGGD
jgi:tetratricopeptide (TPR) repeat protein